MSKRGQRLETLEQGWRPIPIRYVGIVLLVLILVGGAMLAWQGIRRRALVVGLAPYAGAENVSIRAAVHIAFAEPMREDEIEERFEIEPPVDGQIEWAEHTLVFRPTVPLAMEQTYTVTLWMGAHSKRGRPIPREVTWHFRTGSPRLIYLAADEQGRLQLYLEGSPAVALTSADADVWDYAVHPEGTSIVYSVIDKEDRADLWQVDRAGSKAERLLACQDASCTAPSWSANGQRIAYERTDFSETTIGLLSGSLTPHIWLLDLCTGETEPLFPDAPTPGRHPVWAPAGERLAFYDLSESAVRIYDFSSGERQFFDTLADVGTWDPQGEQMILPDIDLHTESGVGYLVSVDFSTRSVQALHEQSQVDDTAPRWSPTGEWVAFGRTALGDGTLTWGAQLWLMQPDGSGARPLVVDPRANLGAFAWRPDGGAIAYIRLPLASIADPRPELWVVSLEDGEARHVADDTIMPGWLP